MEKILAAVKAKHEEGQLQEEKTLASCGKDGEMGGVTGPGKNSGAVKDKAAKASALSDPTGSKGKTNVKTSRGDSTEITLDVSRCVTKEVQLVPDDPKNKKHTRSGQADFDKVTGKVDLCLCLTMHFPRQGREWFYFYNDRVSH